MTNAQQHRCMRLVFGKQMGIMLCLWASAFSQPVGPRVQQASSGDFKRLIEEGGAIIVDVRTVAEFQNLHIADAKQLDLYAEDFRKDILELPRDKTILLYCTSGNRSDIAGKYLVKNGYRQVYNLQRGIIEWISLKYPVVKGNSLLLKQENIYSPLEYMRAIGDDSLVFVDFYAEWCAPCVKMMPMIDSLQAEYHNRVKIIKVNCDLSKDLVQRLRISNVPLFVMYKNKQVVFSRGGTLSRKEIEDIFNRQLSGE